MRLTVVSSPKLSLMSKPVNSSDTGAKQWYPLYSKFVWIAHYIKLQ